MNVQLVRALLEPEGYELRSAFNADEALRTCKKCGAVLPDPTGSERRVEVGLVDREQLGGSHGGCGRATDRIVG